VLSGIEREGRLRLHLEEPAADLPARISHYGLR